MADDRNKNKLDTLYFSDASNLSCHPNSPRGGGGCGAFTHSCSVDSSHDPVSNLSHPFSPAARHLTSEKIKQNAPGKSGIDEFNYSPAVQEIVQIPFNIGPGLTWDGFWRLIYDNSNAAIQKQANNLVARGNILEAEARKLVDSRNELILRVRNNSTPFGELHAEILKPRASLKSLEEFLAEKGSIEAVLKSVGKTRATVDRFAAVSRVVGPVTIVMQITLTAIVIQRADPKDRARVASREIGGLVGGVSGGLGGAWAGCASAAILFSPSLAIPIAGEGIEGGACLVGGILGGLGVSWLTEKGGRIAGEGLYDIVNEMSEFSWKKGQ